MSDVPVRCLRTSVYDAGMTVVLAFLAVLLPASVTLIGYWFKQQAEKRLAQEQEQANRRLALERKQEDDRLKLDAAMRASNLFGPSGGGISNAAMSASGLLALTRLDFADLAVALLVDLWAPKKRPLQHTRLMSARAVLKRLK
jgi:Na+-transporting methylmalonyl-CoA/oxaloacetate decarboxylase gamma subunit